MNFGRMQGMPMMNPMGNPMMVNPMMMNPMYNNNNMNAYQLQQMQNMMKMQQMMMQMNNQGQVDKRMARIQKEFFLCQKDSDLIQIGCSFGLEVENNFNVWKVSMLGPQNTPYAGGVFTIKVYFPQEYPNKGAEFRFVNKIYHLNVDWKNPETYGHICLSSLNEWHTTGRVKSKSCYGVKQALFDIFCLFYNQGIESPYDEEIAKQYRDNKEQFNALAREWTAKYASS